MLRIRKRSWWLIIMLKALADRFAEAFAEKLHHDIRLTIWGYASNESLNVQ